MSPNQIASIRHKLYDYIRVANDEKIRALYILLSSNIEITLEWWQVNPFLTDLDHRFKATETGADPGYTVDQLEASVSKRRRMRYGNG
ncbi:MAG: hypothetical protein Q8938_13225 [Bacteroidota bacterium]|nr:hypothetical protein [Bacteroidota bacterium]MDP4258078.1 hypothetical protein [Bacteroidota bacterium]